MDADQGYPDTQCDPRGALAIPVTLVSCGTQTGSTAGFGVDPPATFTPSSILSTYSVETHYATVWLNDGSLSNTTCLDCTCP